MDPEIMNELQEIIAKLETKISQYEADVDDIYAEVLKEKKQIKKI